ncbi:MAG TPA: excinuclease ABC subunit C [Edaphobacter sp.]|nr:excinuclease ABC subunit C [Edaphobacter sp.]
MTASFRFEHIADFSPERADEVLRSVPALPGVFALHGAHADSQPYLTRTVDLRRRMKRLLAPPESQSKRLNLRDRVARIEYCVTGSEFESALVLYRATSALFGDAEARRRLKLRTPYFLRLTMENEYPRVYSTNRLSKRGLAEMYGPFPSRAAADRYCDAVLDLFKLRRCWEDLEPYPEHPGCIYGEMKKCMEPCKEACTGQQYAIEAQRVKAFFDTSGESLLAEIATEREHASAEMEFEKAASLHAQWQKVKAATTLADSLIRPIPYLKAVILQKSAAVEEVSAQAAVFLVQGGLIAGPELLSTLGVRAVKEQTSVGSSLFAQPLMLKAVPLEGGAEEPGDSPETRANIVIERLESGIRKDIDLAVFSDYLSLLRRWYYRPEKQRAGEIFLPNPDGSWPVRRILNGAARIVLGEPKAMAETQREAVKDAKTRILHEGRADVERVVPVAAKRTAKSEKSE